MASNAHFWKQSIHDSLERYAVAAETTELQKTLSPVFPIL